MTDADEYLLDDRPPEGQRQDSLTDDGDLQTSPEVFGQGPDAEENPVKLETRGVTQQKPQRLFWAQATIYKNSAAAKLREQGLTEEARTLELCHTTYTVAVCKGCSRVRNLPNRCDTFFCPECQPRLARERLQAVEWWTKEIRQPKHVVLTVKNTPDLTKGHVQELRKWFTALRRSKFAANWRGGFYSIETTNEGNGWHLHIHALVDSRWIDAVALSAQWARVTNGMGKIVKVRDARGHDYLKEVTKYCVKPVQLAAWPAPDVAAFVRSFTGVRTFGVFGTLYGARTQFKEWFDFIRTRPIPCECGCCEASFFSESEWLRMDLKPDQPDTARPPPPCEKTLPLAL